MLQQTKIALTLSLIVLVGTLSSPMRSALAGPAPAKSGALFDGRVLDGKISLPGPSLADTPSIEEEVKRRA